MAIVKKRTKTNPKLILRTAHMSVQCVYDLVYAIQHKTVLIIFLVILQTIITAGMLPIGGDGFVQDR